MIWETLLTWFAATVLLMPLTFGMIRLLRDRPPTARHDTVQAMDAATWAKFIMLFSVAAVVVCAAVWTTVSLLPHLR